MVIFNSYVKLPEGNEKSRVLCDELWQCTDNVLSSLDGINVHEDSNMMCLHHIPLTVIIHADTPVMSMYRVMFV